MYGCEVVHVSELAGQMVLHTVYSDINLYTVLKKTFFDFLNTFISITNDLEWWELIVSHFFHFRGKSSTVDLEILARLNFS